MVLDRLLRMTIPDLELVIPFFSYIPHVHLALAFYIYRTLGLTHGVVFYQLVGSTGNLENTFLTMELHAAGSIHRITS